MRVLALLFKTTQISSIYINNVTGDCESKSNYIFRCIFSSFPMAEGPALDLQIIDYKYWSAHA